MSEIRVTMTDVRAAGYCASGLKDWMDGHGFDIRDFVKNGMAVEDMEATGDEHGLRVAEKARERHENGR